MEKQEGISVLQLCSKPPFPKKDGGCLAMANFSENLLALGYKLKVISLTTSKHTFDASAFPENFIEETNFETHFIDTSINAIDAFSALINNEAYNLTRFFSVEFDRYLALHLSKCKYQVIQLESLYMSIYLPTIRRYSKAKVVLRSHNFEYIIWERQAKNSKFFLKKLYLKTLAKQLRVFEENVVTELDGLVTISEIDKSKYTQIFDSEYVQTIPFGIDAEAYQNSSKKSNTKSLFHIGAMDWAPNVEGIQWFIDEVWNSQHTEIKLHLAGKALTDNTLSNLNDSITNHGEVDSALDFMRSYGVMVVPLLSGGGIRIKILEAMAMGIPVIATKTALEGIHAIHKKEVYIANTPKEFNAAIKRYHEEPSFFDVLGENGKKLIHKNYLNASIRNKIKAFYEQLLTVSVS